MDKACIKDHCTRFSALAESVSLMEGCQTGTKSRKLMAIGEPG